MVTSKKSAAVAPETKGRTAAAPRRTASAVTAKPQTPLPKAKTALVDKLLKSAKTVTKAITAKVKSELAKPSSPPDKKEKPTSKTTASTKAVVKVVKKPSSIPAPTKQTKQTKTQTPVKAAKPVEAAVQKTVSKPKSEAAKKLKGVPAAAQAVTPSPVKRSPSPMQATKTPATKRPSAPLSSTLNAVKTGSISTETPKTRSTRSKGPESSPAPIVLASNAAKASFGVFQPAVQPNQPATVVAKKDPLLANNWKSKSVEALSDADIVAMPDSEYMNTVQMTFFRNKLLQLKRDILESANETTEHLRDDSSVVPDPTDRATIEEEHALELRTRDRERKLLKKIEQSIARIDAGDYGYCDETGEPIGTGRLLARPTATLSLEAQQRRELKQKLFGD